MLGKCCYTIYWGCSYVLKYNIYTIYPHLGFLEGAARSLSALARRLLLHLPQGEQVKEVVQALVTGKVCYSSIRLSDEDSIYVPAYAGRPNPSEQYCTPALGCDLSRQDASGGRDLQVKTAVPEQICCTCCYD